jgi:signal peptidase I
MRVLLRVVGQIVAAVALFLVTRAFVVEMFNIPTPSMQNTLMVGDFLVVDKMRYGAFVPFTHLRLPAIRHPERGDIIVFRWPVNPDINFVKRVVGVPGDTLWMHDGELSRNGHDLRERYVTHLSPNTDPYADAFNWQRDYLVSSLHAGTGPATLPRYWPSRNNWGPLIVPPGHYFVLGDNRDNSLDSRYWGFVPDSLVRGTPLFVYFSCVPDTASRFSCLTHARWKRFGTIVR